MGCPAVVTLFASHLVLHSSIRDYTSDFVLWLFKNDRPGFNPDELSVSGIAEAYFARHFANIISDKTEVINPYRAGR
jgi:hypothetical protein